MSSAFLPRARWFSVLAPWGKAVFIVAFFNAGLAGAAFLNPALFEKKSDFGGETVIEIAPVVMQADADDAPESQESVVEDKAAAPDVSEVRSAKLPDDIPVEMAAPVEALDPELRMAQEKTQKQDEQAKEEAQTTEAMQAQQQQTSTQASQASEASQAQEGQEAAENSSAPEEGTSQETARKIAAWQRALLGHVAKYKSYPDQARARRITGEAAVSFTLMRDGAVSQVRVIRSSGHALLDQAALEVLQKANPLPKMPPEMRGNMFSLTLPIRYHLK